MEEREREWVGGKVKSIANSHRILFSQKVAHLSKTFLREKRLVRGDSHLQVSA